METEQNIPQTGPEAISYALEHISRNDLEQQADKLLQEGKKTGRTKAVQLLNIARGMERNNLQPKDYVISAVPVIPTKYRPFAAQGDTLLPGDANVLYKDLIDVRNAYNEEREVFGDENVGDSRLATYDAVRSVYGYGDPVKPKTKAKGVKGFLKAITGSTSKFSYVQSKLLAKTQDNVGRSTIIVNPDMDIDQIGIPKDMAFTMYAPYIQRKLKGMGLSDAEALKNTSQRTDMALKALEEVVKERPVIYSRAPSWHRFSVNAGNVKLIDGDAIETNPYVAAGLGADYDGNCIIGSSHIVVKIDKDSPFWDITAGMGMDYEGLWQKNIKIIVDNSQTAVYTDVVMKITASTQIALQTQEGNIINLPIESVPYIPESKRYDSHGAEVYDVVPGMKVLSTAIDGKGTRWEPFTTLTIEDGCSLRKVTTMRKKEVTVSSNESVAVLDYDACAIVKVKPDEINDRFVPVVKSFPIPGKEASFSYGWLLGMFLSDGTFDGKTLTLTKVDDRVRFTFLCSLGQVIGNANIIDTARTYSEVHEAATNCGISGESKKIHVKGRLLPEWFKEVLLDCYDKNLDRSKLEKGERACLYKKFPAVVRTWGKDALVGLLSGFLDGDGCVSLNTSGGKRKTPQLLINISTSSSKLKEGIVWLGKMLGVSVAVTGTHPAAGRVQKHVNYTCTFSTSDLRAYADELHVFSDYEKHLEKLHTVGYNNFDIVPISYNILHFVQTTVPADELDKLGITKAALASIKSEANKTACKYTKARREVAEVYARVLRTISEKASGQLRKEIDLFLIMEQDKSTGWEKVVSVEEAPTERVYDIAVPGTKVFALENGLVIYDTINVHVPASDDAVKEAYDKLMPSQDPFSDRIEGKIVPLPKQEQILGLYTAATAPSTKSVVFDTEEEAIHAIRSGKVPLSADVQIRNGVKMASVSQNAEMLEKIASMEKSSSSR